VIVYGRNPVREAIRGPRRVTRVWAGANARREQWLRPLAGVITGVGAEELERICGSPEHQGICAEVSPFHYADAADLLGLREPMLLALDQVQDPQNVGAIARTAECAGASGMVLPERRSAQVTPAVCKASAGAVEHLPIARVRNLADFLEQAKRAGMWCYGADQGANSRYDTLDLGGPLVLVLGSEGRGLRPRVAAACDALVSIPLQGRIESLSVSAAAAVLAFEVARNRQRNMQQA
jgi:23S rRNA (guanosine2251-2'-O)-methyltransferase